jgi:hypothetical protein
MPIQYEPNPDRFRGTGTAFIAWEPYDRDYLRSDQYTRGSLPSPLDRFLYGPRSRHLLKWGCRGMRKRVLLGGGWRAPRRG